MRNSRQVIRISLLSVSLFLLFLYTYTTSFWKYVYGSSVIRNLSVYLTILLLCFLVFKTGLKKNSGLYLIGIALLLFIVLNNQDLAHGDVYYIRGILPMFLFAAVPKQSDRWIRTGLNFILVISLVYAFFTIWFSFDPDFYRSHVLPLFDRNTQQQLMYSLKRGASAGIAKHYSLNGTYLTEGLLAALCMYIGIRKSNKNVTKTCMKTAILFILFALFLTGKRAHILFFSLTLLISYYVYTGTDKRNRNLKLICLIIAAVIGFIVASHFVPSVALFYDRFVESAGNGDVTLGRIEYYKVALSYFLKNPLFGIGWGGFKYVNVDYGGYSAGSYANTHNVYLQLLCETGIVGTLLFTGLMLYLPFISANLIKRERSSGNSIHSSRLLYAFMLQVFVIMYGFTGNPIYDLEVLALYMFGAAVTLYYQQYPASV